MHARGLGKTLAEERGTPCRRKTWRSDSIEGLVPTAEGSGGLPSAVSGLVERSFGYRLGPKASAIRASNSFFTSFFGSGSSTGKCSEPLVFVYPSVSLASRGITEPLCGR